jgi:hypothetical protein
MAYPIQNKTTGFYQIFEFAAESDSELIDKLELAYRRDEQVLRYLTIKLDKHAMIYNERRRKGEFNKPKEVEKPEAPAETKAEAPAEVKEEAPAEVKAEAPAAVAEEAPAAVEPEVTKEAE